MLQAICCATGFQKQSLDISKFRDLDFVAGYYMHIEIVDSKADETV